ncbi:MAG TPA: hypothetical protein VE861_13390 [Gemmatimonadaceae bacterium]|nr:hypothetical protein [Gemmatimonadaceae bacterium]
MPADDADRLGPKGHVYVELVREQWRAPLERGTARRALLTSALGIALILFGLIGAFVVYGESFVLIGIGAFAFYSSLGEIRGLMPEFREARRIGWVEPSLDDGSVTLGEPATFRIVLHARQAQVIRSATVVAEARQWHRSTPGAVLASIPLQLAEEERVAAGDDWRQSVTFRIPDSAPPSFYDSMESVRWTLATELTLAGTAPWTRTWPMLVFPPDAP